MKKIRTLLYVLKQGIANIFKNKLYSLASVATIAACLFLFGIFYAVMANFQSIVVKAEEGVSVTVFFHNDYDKCESHTEAQLLTEEDIKALEPQIAARSEVSDVVYISDEEAWETFATEYYGENYAEGFLDNPLAGEYSYEIYLKDVSKQGELVDWLNSIPCVRKVNFSEVTADTLSGANLLIAYVSGGIILVLLAVSIFLIHNTVAIGINRRAEEIGIMKYVGATDFFVRSPFVIECMIIGLIGAGIPLMVIRALYNFALSYVTERFTVLSNFLNFLSVQEVFKVLNPVMLGLGVGIGFIGSFITARKYLRV